MDSPLSTLRECALKKGKDVAPPSFYTSTKLRLLLGTIEFSLHSPKTPITALNIHNAVRLLHAVDHLLRDVTPREGRPANQRRKRRELVDSTDLRLAASVDKWR